MPIWWTYLMRSSALVAFRPEVELLSVRRTLYCELLAPEIVTLAAGGSPLLNRAGRAGPAA